MLKTSKIFIFMLLLISTLSANQTPPATNTVDNNASLKAAEKLLASMNMDKTYGKMIEKITSMQMRQNPQLKQIEPVLHDFFNKYMGWDSLKDDMAKIYAEHYTATELEEIGAFYQTKVGQKTIKLMPTLAAEGAKLGQSKISEHMGELQTLIESSMAKAMMAEEAADNAESNTTEK